MMPKKYMPGKDLIDDKIRNSAAGLMLLTCMGELPGNAAIPWKFSYALKIIACPKLLLSAMAVFPAGCAALLLPSLPLVKSLRIFLT